MRRLLRQTTTTTARQTTIAAQPALTKKLLPMAPFLDSVEGKSTIVILFVQSSK
jgi:hypothetical protein